MRASGILLPVTSLPSPYGIGCFSKEAYEFVDQLEKGGEKYWQILPLGPTGYGDSPYQSFSTFAGNPYFIDLEEFIQRDLLTAQECAQCDWGGSLSYVDYEKIYHSRFALLRKAYHRFYQMDTKKKELELLREEMEAFEKEQGFWLEDYCLYMAVKDSLEGISWNEWPEELKTRKPEALAKARQVLREDISFYAFQQFWFYRQWSQLKKYANDRDIKIIGDLPIYVAFDGADAWANPDLFQFDQEATPVAVAGCPPDGFSATGQLWGNPLFDWEYMEKNNYDWWVRRIQYLCKVYDILRIDHFRGFDAYYAIPASAETAKEGTWEAGPGLDFFRAMEKVVGQRPIIAEDLGFMTDSVKRLVEESGYPNMKVIEFAFDARDTGNASDYLPHNYTNNCVVYTGTHDNETLLGWYSDITPEERHMVREYLWNFHDDEKGIWRNMIRLVMGSAAGRCIIPIQDYLQLDNTARINQPSTLGINWKWRLTEGQFTKELQKEMLALVTRFGRRNWTPDPVEEEDEEKEEA